MPTQSTSQNSLAPVNPLDAALIKLLTTAPANWSPSRYEELSNAEQNALVRLVESGLVEARIELAYTMPGFRGCVWARFRVTGAWHHAANNEMLRRLPPEWLTSDGGTKNGLLKKISAFLEIRLTLEGERKKGCWLRGSPDDRADVLGFLRGNGFFPGGVAPADVKVEDSKVRGEEGSGRNMAAAQANAQASIRNVVVNNQINVPAPNVVVQITPATAEPEQGGTTDAGSPNPPGKMGVSLLDAALIMTDGDSGLATKVKRRWHNSQDPTLPLSIGIAKKHGQRKLYEPSALFGFIKNIEGPSSCKERRLKEALQGKLQPVLPPTTNRLKTV